MNYYERCLKRIENCTSITHINGMGYGIILETNCGLKCYTNIETNNCDFFFKEVLIALSKEDAEILSGKLIDKADRLRITEIEKILEEL